METKTVTYWVPGLFVTGVDDATLAAGIARGVEWGGDVVAFVDNTAFIRNGLIVKIKDPYGALDPHIVAMAKVKR